MFWVNVLDQHWDGNKQSVKMHRREMPKGGKGSFSQKVAIKGQLRTIGQLSMGVGKVQRIGVGHYFGRNSIIQSAK